MFVAFAGGLFPFYFVNPRKLTWATYRKKQRGTYKHHAGHLNHFGVVCAVGNLVMTRRRNLDMYRKDAKAKRRAVNEGRSREEIYKQD